MTAEAGHAPGRNYTSQQGDLHLQLRPGTDVALTNGILHVLIQEGLTDNAFIAGRTNGWEETREMAMRYTPDDVMAAMADSSACA